MRPLRWLHAKLNYRWLPFLYAWTLKFTLKVIGSTCTFHVEGLDVFQKTAAKKTCILLFWHNRLAMIPAILSLFSPQFRYAALVSKSRDGQIIATLANSYRQGRSIRVPHNKRSEALRKLIRELKARDEIFLITPDGPRGPRYQMKPGVVLAAKATTATVFPLSWKASRYWRLKTWDRFILPKPFSKIHVKLGNPLNFPKHHQKRTLDEETKILEKALQDLL